MTDHNDSRLSDLMRKLADLRAGLAKAKHPTNRRAYSGMVRDTERQIARLSDREPLALRVIAEHNADLVTIMRQADRNLQIRHDRTKKEN